jgi:hypothetical protein
MRIVRRTALAAAGPLLVLGAALAASPAYADTTPTPVASEGSGGAACAPSLTTAGCGQDTGATPASTAVTTTTSSSSSSSKATSSSSTKATTSGSNLARTGTLARTGAGSPAPWGLAGLALITCGTLAVVATRPRHDVG